MEANKKNAVQTFVQFKKKFYYLVVGVLIASSVYALTIQLLINFNSNVKKFESIGIYLSACCIISAVLTILLPLGKICYFTCI